MFIESEKTAPVLQRLKVEPEAIAAFCRKWKITELALFGSVLRDDFRDDSDVDMRQGNFA